MKKIILIVLATILALSVACSQADKNGAVNGKKQGTARVGAENKPGVDGDEKKAEGNYPPMVKVAGVVYKDTGYENAMVTCGTADGEIKTTVDGKKMPPMMMNRISARAVAIKFGTRAISMFK